VNISLCNYGYLQCIEANSKIRHQRHTLSSACRTGKTGNLGAVKLTNNPQYACQADKEFHKTTVKYFRQSPVGS
jgi:hypothetical protein